MKTNDATTTVKHTLSRYASGIKKLTCAVFISSLSFQAVQASNHEATNSHTNSTEDYAGVYDGYWSVVGVLDDGYGAIKFNKTTMDNYRFECNGDEYQQINVENYPMQQSGNRFIVDWGDGEKTVLTVLRYVPQKHLVLKQTFIGSDELLEMFPDGITFRYLYRGQAQPLCAYNHPHVSES